VESCRLPQEQEFGDSKFWVMDYGKRVLDSVRTFWPNLAHFRKVHNLIFAASIFQQMSN
jgi:hypothetical protein